MEGRREKIPVDNHLVGEASSKAEGASNTRGHLLQWERHHR